ncbi:MAG: hypothetical protein ACC742_06150 [Thermoanaerobaculales bacterium]
MALNNLGLGFVFTARDLASAKMQRLERRFSSLDERVTGGTNRMTSAFRQLGIGLAVFTAGAVAVGGALALANAAGRFEQGLAAIVAVLGAVVAGFVVAFRRNVGGIADFAQRMWERVTLFFRGLKQLFEQGGFSGAVREELNRAENQGLKRFLSSTHRITYYVARYIAGNMQRLRLC